MIIISLPNTNAFINVKKSPLTPLFQRGDKTSSPFEKGGLRGT
jgi:hypothetical protein